MISCTQVKDWARKWGDVTLYLFSIVLYVFDLSMDIVVGASLVNDSCDRNVEKCDDVITSMRHNQGTIILVCCFCPVFALFSIVTFRKIDEWYLQTSLLQSPAYTYTLVGVDWLDEEDVKGKKEPKKWVILKFFLVLFRLEVFLTYIRLFKYTYKRNKEKNNNNNEETERSKKMNEYRKRYDIEFRAGMFLEACFESLPQCCIQIYIFGKASVVSNAQIISFTLSITSLCFTFILSEYYRHQKLWKVSHTKKTVPLVTDINIASNVTIENGFRKTGNEGEGCIVFHSDEKSFQATFQMDDNVNKRPKHINMALHFTSNEDDTYYELRHVQVKSKRKVRGKLRENIGYCVRVVDMAICSITSFSTALPAIALFSSLYGDKYLFLIVPIIGQFAAQYWWWRPKTKEKALTVSFQTLFIAFKLLLRMVTWGCLCIWFLKVIEYSKPKPEAIPNFIQTFDIWPNADSFLTSISRYNRNGKTQDWKSECHSTPISFKNISSSTNINSTATFERLTMTTRDNCAIDVDKYVFSIAFFMNLIGMAWECLYYLFIMFVLIYTKTNEWPDAHVRTERTNDDVGCELNGHALGGNAENTELLQDSSTTTTV